MFHSVPRGPEVFLGDLLTIDRRGETPFILLVPGQLFKQYCASLQRIIQHSQYYNSVTESEYNRPNTAELQDLVHSLAQISPSKPHQAQY